MRATRQVADPERYFNDILRVFDMNRGQWVSMRFIADRIDMSVFSARSVIREMRLAGIPIIGRKHTGYKMAQSDGELLYYIAKLEEDIEARQETVDALKRITKGEWK